MDGDMRAGLRRKPWLLETEWPPLPSAAVGPHRRGVPAYGSGVSHAELQTHIGFYLGEPACQCKPAEGGQAGRARVRRGWAGRGT